jgi:ribosomal protein S12 methylthiotransferase accessory factor
VPCVKVVVPGFRGVAPRFGPGRLFDIPVGMGWVDRPRRPDELNPEFLRM